MGWPRFSIISGGFDPLHVGHVRLIKEAFRYMTPVIIILNNDNWLIQKKGFVFMPQDERKEILEGFSEVKEVIISNHEPYPTDMSVCKELKMLAEAYINIWEFELTFCNGGDRKEGCLPTVEEEICKELGIQMRYNVGGEKIQSSSALAAKIQNQRQILEVKK